MHNILSKKNVLILEAAVQWNKSALGILSNALFRPISFLTGSIKKGLNKQQMNILVKQWGLEYVNAIKLADIDDTDSVDNSDDIDDVDNSSGDSILTEEQKTKILTDITKYNTNLLALKKIVQPLLSWSNVDTKEKEFIKLKSSIVIDIIDPNYLIFLKDKKIKNTDNYKKNVDIINSFLTNIKKSQNISDYLNIAQDISKFNSTIKLTLASIDDLLDINEIVSSELNNEELGNNTAPKNKKEYNTGDKIKYQKNTGDVAEATVDVQKDVNSGFIKIKTKNSSFVIKLDKIVESYNYFINEASEYRLPNNVTDLLSIDEINKLKQDPDIKKKITDKLNFERLNTIMYEANYLIEKLNDKDRKDESKELKRVWDLGVQNTNDYFQDLVDVNKIKNQVKGSTDSNTKKIIVDEQEKLNTFQKIGASEVFAVGDKFDNKKLYAFDIMLTGQNNKIKKIILFMSPTQDFVEDVAGEKYFWFKLFGAYTFDEKNKKIIRTNPFSKLTQNSELVSSLMTEGDSVYISTKMLRPSASSSYVFIYDKNGKFFYNTKKYNTSDVATEIMKYKKDDLNKSLKDIANTANIMKIKIIQRFVIEDSNISSNKYPGISLSILNNDKGINTAKTNHDKLLNLLGT
jgi:hypothetical protein